MVGPGRLAARRLAAPPYLASALAVPAHRDAARAEDRSGARPWERQPLARRTRAPPRAVRDRVRVGPRRCGAARVQPPRRGARGVVVGGGRVRTGHCPPARQLPDIDRRSRGGDVRRGPWGRIRPPPVASPPPEAPRLALARPPAARHTGRAALPSAIFPHALPAVAQNSWTPADHCSIAAAPLRAKPVTFVVIIPPLLGSPAT